MSQFSTVDPAKYVALFRIKGEKTFEKHPLVALVLEDDGGLVGYVAGLDSAGRFRRADTFSNFAGYGEAGSWDAVIVPAQQGWWAVWKEEDGTDGFREPILAWRISDSGWTLQAIVPPDKDGYAEPLDPSREDVKCEFRYEPQSTEGWRADPSPEGTTVIQ